MTTVEEVPVSKERDRLAADLRPWVERNVVSPNAAYCGRCYDVVLRRFNDSPACQTVIKKLTFMGELSDQPELSCKIDKTGWILSSVVEAALRDVEKQPGRFTFLTWHDNVKSCQIPRWRGNLVGPFSPWAPRSLPFVSQMSGQP
jgi:hypothetical protein